MPLSWVLAFVSAALFHELCHYLAIRLTGNAVYEVAVSSEGMIMSTMLMQPWQELLCALAGPMGSLLLFLLYPWIPRIGLCAGVQGLFNLLPLYPLDGGRAFRILAERWFPRHWASICRWIERIVVLCVCLLGLWVSVGLRLGTGPIFLTAAVLSRTCSEKFLANRGN